MFRPTNGASSHTGLSAMFEGCELDGTPAHGARLDLDPFSQGSAQPCRALQFSSQQQLSQTSIFAASQELGTQDFATPSHNRRAPASQLASQPMIAPALGPPPACDVKRARVEQTEGAPMEVDFSFPKLPQQTGGELKGQKKLRALAPPKVQPIIDLSTCSPEEADVMDIRNVLRSHAVVAGTPGSYSCCYEEIAVLGQGAFGKVAHVRSLVDGGEYAVKMTTESRELNDAEVKRVLFEGQLMRQLFADKSVPGAPLEFHGMWIESMQINNQQRFRLYMRMELCKRNLASMLRQHRFSEQELVDVATVLEIMHRKHFAHLDIKPANLLQSMHSARTTKLGDYGNAVRTDGTWEVLDGDRAYLPLELLQGHCPDKAAADIFSLGISVLELATGKPLPQDGEQYHALRSGKLPALPYSQQLCNRIKDMMHPDPSKRPTAHKLAHSTLSSPHFTDGKENSCSHGNAVGKGQITQLVGNGQGSMFGKKTGSAGSKDGKRKVESKGARSAASGPSLTSFLKTTF